MWLGMSDAEKQKVESQEIWVDLYEAAEITGYNYHSMRRLIYGMGQQPEDERAIKIRKRTSRWELWLPDLLVYVDKPRPGPPLKRKKE